MTEPDQAREKLSLVGIGREVLGTYRAYWWPLLVTAGIIFGPITLLDALTEELRDLETHDGVALGEAVGAGVSIGALSLLGEVFYAGVVAAIVMRHRKGERRTLGEVARELPYGTLILVDLAFAGLVILGFVALILPGLWVIARLGLAGPAAEIEGLGVRAALRRSLELSRGHALKILALLVPLLLVGDGLGEAAGASGLWILGDGVAGEWLGDALTEILTAPLFGLAAAITAHHLIALRPATGTNVPRTPL
jgi:hypothetical protein